jgi:NAD(P)H-dependent FMN reductase
MYIPIVLGTARKGRQSEKAAKYILGMAKKAGLDTEIVDVRDYRIEATDNTEEIPQAKKWGEKMAKADGLIIVAPEYNHTYPGELKMFLDMIFDQYHRKPVGLVGVSMGPLGGSRGIQALRLTCIGLRMHPIYEAVYFPMVQDQFDENGEIKNKIFDKQTSGLLNSLVSQAKALKSGQK